MFRFSYSELLFNLLYLLLFLGICLYAIGKIYSIYVTEVNLNRTVSKQEK